MTTTKDKLKSLASKEKTNTLERNRERIKNRTRLREAQQIALKVLKRLDDLRWTQKRLAEIMEVTPQQINKIVKGTENLTLETIVKLQSILEIPILSSYKQKEKESPVISYSKEGVPSQNIMEDVGNEFSFKHKEIVLTYDPNSSTYDYSKAG